MIGPFLVLIGAFLALVSVKGKSFEFLNAMFPSIQASVNSEEQKLDATITNWAQENLWTPITTAIKNALPGWLGGGSGSGSGSSSNSTNIAGVTGSGGGGGNNLVGHYTVNLFGGGSMSVNANSAQDAINNVIAEGGTPKYG